MKSRQYARGIVGALSLLGVIGAVGCGAATDEQGAAGEGEIGSTEQAVVLSPNLAPSLGIEFTGQAVISGTSKVLVLGGYRLSDGAGTTTAAIFDPTLASSPADLRWQNLSVALPTALGEVEVAPIPGQTNKFLVAGGRASLDGNAVTNTYILSLSGTDLLTASWVTPTDQLTTGRVIGLKNLQKCGTSKLIALGGIKSAGMQDLVNQDATDEIEVFTFNAGTPLASTWDPLKDGSNNTIKLQTPRGYAEVFHVSDTDMRVVGGMNANAIALGTVDKLTVNSSCVAQNATGAHLLEVAAPLPSSDVRARFSSIPVSVTITTPATKSFEYLMAGGSDLNPNSDNVRPTTTYLYNENGTTGTSPALAGEWVAANTMSEGRIFPRFAKDGSFAKLVTGLKPNPANPFDPYYNTSSVVDKFNLSITSLAATPWSTGTALTTDRVGSFAEFVNSTFYVGPGLKHTNTAGTSAVAASAAANAFETF